MARSHRLAVDLPQPLLEHVKKLAERRGLTLSGAIVAIVGEHLDYIDAAEKPQKKKGK